MKTTLLCINCNRPMNYLLESVLSGRYQFIAVDNVYKGMECLKNDENISLVIIDIDIKSQENWDFIEHITSSILFSKKVIVITDDDSDLMNERLTIAKVNERFLKPFNPLDLVKIIDSLTLVDSLAN